MAHLGMETVIINLMLNSASPLGRRRMEELLTGDPYNVDIKLTDDCKNRNVEIVNAYLKTCGLALRFYKKPKNIKPGIIYGGIKRYIPVSKPGLVRIHPDEKCHNDNYINEALEYEKENGKKGIIYDGLIYD